MIPHITAPTPIYVYCIGTKIQFFFQTINMTDRALKDYFILDGGYYICQIPARRNPESKDKSESSDQAVCGVRLALSEKSSEGRYLLLIGT